MLITAKNQQRFEFAGLPGNSAAMNSAKKPLGLQLAEVPTNGLGRDLESSGELGYLGASSSQGKADDLALSLGLEERRRGTAS